MYPNDKYMNDNNPGNLSFTPLSSEISNQIYNPVNSLNFYTPVIMKEPFKNKNDMLMNKQSKSYIRFFHTAHSKGNVDVYINSQLIIKNLKYSSMTSYIAIPAGNYTIKIYKSGMNEKPLIICKVATEKNKHYTFVVIEDNNRLKTLMLSSENKASDNNRNIHVRFINLIPFSPLLNVSLNNEEHIINDVEYGESTNYIDLPADTYSFDIFSDNRDLKAIVVPKVSLSPGTYYTIFVIGRADLQGAHKALLYKDI